MKYLIIFAAIISNSWLIYFFVKKFKNIYLADPNNNLIKLTFFGWATIQAWMIDTIFIKFMFFNGQSSPAIYIDLIFIIIVGFFIIRSMINSYVPKINSEKQSLPAKVLFISLFVISCIFMFKISYF